ncbi:MAG TPA: ATP-binding protein [Chloroflexia bacterium]|nr:ATP-binding protein [Chloroflexia bacterium]
MERSQPSGAWGTGLKAKLLARVPFWRAFFDTIVVGLLLTLFGYVVGPVLGTPWLELISYSSVAAFVFAAWRLAPGKGNFVQKVAHDLAWGVLLTLSIWAMSLLCFQVLAHFHDILYFGVSFADLDVTPGRMLFGALLVTFAPFVLARILVSLWDAGRRRLLWRLTYSYLLVTVLGVLIVLPFGFLYISVASLFSAPVLLEPGVGAMRATAAIQPVLQNGTAAADLDPLLRGMLDGKVRLPMPAGVPVEFGTEPPSFEGVRRLTVLDLDGVVLASAAQEGQATYPGGQRLPEEQATRNAALLAQARASGCSNGRPAGGPYADAAACVINGSDGAPVALLLLETRADSSFQFGLELSRIVAIVLTQGSAALYILSFSVLGLLLVAGGAAVLLSRRLTRRLERLTEATGAIASGDLTRRVKVETIDELGRLSTDFNAMAERLEEREIALKAEKERVEHLLQANRRLVADVSHELRTPLATLRGYVEVLESEHGHQIPERDLRVIQGEIARLTSLIEDLFTLARAEAHQLPLTIESVDATALVGRLADSLAPLARRDRQIEIVTALPANLPRVKADRVRLEQVVLNLLQNALRYTLPGGIIAVEGRADDGVVTLSIDDTGVGIPAEELEMVFERFYRSDQSRARESGGAGIGLALVKELVGAMDGKVWVQSTPGRGSRFSVALPQAG